MCFFFFFFNDTATTEIYTLSLHDALPILSTVLPLEGVALPPRGPRSLTGGLAGGRARQARVQRPGERRRAGGAHGRSEEHTSELQSRQYLVCRLLLEKKKKHKDKI